MIAALKRLTKILQALIKIVPVIIEILGDFADDGKRNNSNSRKAVKPDPSGTESTSK